MGSDPIWGHRVTATEYPRQHSGVTGSTSTGHHITVVVGASFPVGPRWVKSCQVDLLTTKISRIACTLELSLPRNHFSKFIYTSFNVIGEKFSDGRPLTKAKKQVYVRTYSSNGSDSSQIVYLSHWCLLSWILSWSPVFKYTVMTVINCNVILHVQWLCMI